MSPSVVKGRLTLNVLTLTIFAMDGNRNFSLDSDFYCGGCVLFFILQL